MGSAADSPLGIKLFIVHGHDGMVKLEVAEFIQRITGERPVILHEQPSYGSRTVIEKFKAAPRGRSRRRLGRLSQAGHSGRSSDG
jgi:predicted nucleotide-binding protein